MNRDRSTDNDAVTGIKLVALKEQSEPLMGNAEDSISHEKGSMKPKGAENVDQSIDHTASTPKSPAPNHSSSNNPVLSESVNDMQILRSGGTPMNRKRHGSSSDSPSQRLTMTGKVTRGVSVGQPVEVIV